MTYNTRTITRTVPAPSNPGVLRIKLVITRSSEGFSIDGNQMSDDDILHREPYMFCLHLGGCIEYREAAIATLAEWLRSHRDTAITALSFYTTTLDITTQIPVVSEKFTVVEWAGPAIGLQMQRGGAPYREWCRNEAALPAAAPGDVGAPGQVGGARVTSSTDLLASRHDALLQDNARMKRRLKIIEPILTAYSVAVHEATQFGEINDRTLDALKTAKTDYKHLMSEERQDAGTEPPRNLWQEGYDKCMADTKDAEERVKIREVSVYRREKVLEDKLADIEKQLKGAQDTGVSLKTLISKTYGPTDANDTPPGEGKFFCMRGVSGYGTYIDTIERAEKAAKQSPGVAYHVVQLIRGLKTVNVVEFLSVAQITDKPQPKPKTTPVTAQADSDDIDED